MKYKCISSEDLSTKVNQSVIDRSGGQIDLIKLVFCFDQVTSADLSPAICYIFALQGQTDLKDCYKIFSAVFIWADFLILANRVRALLQCWNYLFSLPLICLFYFERGVLLFKLFVDKFVLLLNIDFTAYENFSKLSISKLFGSPAMGRGLPHDLFYV